MDLKFKSPNWVGSMYHKFEAICHEVDDFVSQESVKYVENQAQAVGGSVKRFYSSVVQDLLPSSLTQPGNHEAQILHLEQNEMDEPNISCSEIEDFEHNKLDFVLAENNLKGEITDKNHETSFKENDQDEVQMSKMPFSFKESDLKEEWVNTNGNIVEAVEPNMEGTDVRENEQKIIVEAVEPNMEGTDVRENEQKIELYRPKEMKMFYPEKIASLSSGSKIGLTCDTHRYDTETNLSVVSADNTTVQSESISSNSPSSSDMVDFQHNENNTCYYLVNEIENVSDPTDALSSSQSLSVVSCDVTDMKQALSSSAFDEDVPSADDIAALVASFEDNDYAHLEALMSSLKFDEEDDSIVDIADPSMVSIELFDDEAKLDESCIPIENRLLYAVFSRSWKHKSYKKILLDAFASRKRLKKEYEQLGILLGDINIEPSQQHVHNIPPDIHSSSLRSDNLQCVDISEWELL